MSWTVADVMTRDPVVVGPDADFKTCVRLMDLHEVSALPVVDEDGRPLGVVSESDLLAKERLRDTHRSRFGIRHHEEDRAIATSAGEMMTRPAVCIRPTASIPQAARLMYRETVKRLPVVDERGVVIGVVSRADLLKTFTRSDESIRRDIVENVIAKDLMIDPAQVEVEVVNGRVTLAGRLESKSLAGLLVRMTERVDGTVSVDDRIGYRLDDTRLGVEAPARSLQLAAPER